VEPKLTSVIGFLVDTKTPHRALTEATESGLGAARAVAGPTLDATGSLGTARGATRSVRVALTLRASPAAALQAEAAFARAFMERLETRGFSVARA
jgi:hypothetical protein